jgi:hypothetical protein
MNVDVYTDAGACGDAPAEPAPYGHLAQAVPPISKSAVSPPALKKQLLEVVAWQPVPQPGGLLESSRWSSASEPPGSRPETDCTPGRGARATQPETIHLRRSFLLHQHPQGVPALRDKPAGCTASCCIRPLGGLPIWKSAIGPVGPATRDALRLAQAACKVQLEHWILTCPPLALAKVGFSLDFGV